MPRTRRRRADPSHMIELVTNAETTPLTAAQAQLLRSEIAAGDAARRSNSGLQAALRGARAELASAASATDCRRYDHAGRLETQSQELHELRQRPTRWAYEQAVKALWHHRQRGGTEQQPSEPQTGDEQRTCTATLNDYGTLLHCTLTAGHYIPDVPGTFEGAWHSDGEMQIWADWAVGATPHTDAAPEPAVDVDLRPPETATERMNAMLANAGFSTSTQVNAGADGDDDADKQPSALAVNDCTATINTYGVPKHCTEPAGHYDEARTPNHVDHGGWHLDRTTLVAWSDSQFGATPHRDEPPTAVTAMVDRLMPQLPPADPDARQRLEDAFARGGITELAQLITDEWEVDVVGNPDERHEFTGIVPTLLAAGEPQTDADGNTVITVPGGCLSLPPGLGHLAAEFADRYEAFRKPPTGRSSTPSPAVIAAARHLDLTEGPLALPGHVLDNADLSAIRTVTRYIAEQHRRGGEQP